MPRILVVEDQENTAEMLTSYFKAQGYEVTSVGFGHDALAFVEQTVPDLIMLDIRLPDIDGYEVCRRLRAHRRTERVPVLFLTERREREARLMGLELGAVDYVTKPFDVQELRLRVRNVLRRSKLDRQSHPITGLPSAPLADERLRELLTSSDWAVLSVGLCGLKKFAEVYGFVTRDDVVRAMALMLRHVVGEVNEPDAFVGHLDDFSFFVVVTPGKVQQVQQAITLRLRETIAFFYPRTDWETGQTDSRATLPPLSVTMGVVASSAGPFSSLADLRRAIVQSRRPLEHAK